MEQNENDVIEQNDELENSGAVACQIERIVIRDFEEELADSNEPQAFSPCWPVGTDQNTAYRVKCDDKGRNGGSWLDVVVAVDGDVHLMMQDWEEIPEGNPDPNPTIRVRTLAGGGRNLRTHQALLWLADAIRRDNEENAR